jgi:hypothetical protein
LTIRRRCGEDAERYGVVADPICPIKEVILMDEIATLPETPAALPETPAAEELDDVVEETSGYEVMLIQGIVY